MKPKSQKLDLEAAARLVQPRDSLLCGFVAGQPVGFLEVLDGSRVHRAEVDAGAEHETERATLPEEAPWPEELAIARRVCDRIQPEAILQVGIGAIPDEIARILAERPAGGFGTHTEMIAD